MSYYLHSLLRPPRSHYIHLSTGGCLLEWKDGGGCGGWRKMEEDEEDEEGWGRREE